LKNAFDLEGILKKEGGQRKTLSWEPVKKKKVRGKRQWATISVTEEREHLAYDL